MGKKKTKGTETTTTTENDVGDGTPSSVFKSIFGDVEDQNAAVFSIFSDNNPFKRKPQESNENHKNDDVSVETDVAELKKRKRNKNKEEKSNLDQDSIQEEEEVTETTPLVRKKDRKPKTQIPNLGSESNGESKTEISQNPNMGSEFDAKSVLNDGQERRKKKRKRDEVEREYEGRRYGANEAEEVEVEGKVVGEKRKKVDDAADMMVPKEGFDDESKLLRTVFLGNLPMKVKKKVLLKEFNKFGEVESVRIRSVPLMDTKVPRKGAILRKQINEQADSVHAYIVFKTEQSAEASLAHNMAVVGGNHIRVDRACPPRKKLKGDNAPLYDNKRTVFVGNLPYDVKDEELYQVFFGINGLESSVEAIRVIRHPDIGMGKGIAYVLFKTREAANLVVKKRNLKLRDRDLRLSHARQDSTPSKRKNPSPARENTSPAKKLAVDSRALSDSNDRSNSKANMSYQGLRASKSSVEKKVRLKSNGPVQMKSKSQKGGKLKARETKRPAVAARKAKVLKVAGASKHAGSKRKLDSHTPESSHRNKRAKKFR